MPEVEPSDVRYVRFRCFTARHDRVLDFHTDNSLQREVSVRGGLTRNRATAWYVRCYIRWAVVPRTTCTHVTLNS